LVRPFSSILSFSLSLFCPNRPVGMGNFYLIRGRAATPKGPVQRNAMQ
jgi:hypothetical protein